MNNLTWAEVGEFVTAYLPKLGRDANPTLHRILGNQACRILAETTRLRKGVWDNSDRVIADCEAAWTAKSNVVATADYTYRKTGRASAHIHFEDAFVTGPAAYADISGGPLDMTALGVTQIALRLRSSVARAAGQLTVGLDDSATFASAESVDLPAIYQPHEWVRVVVDLSAGQLALTAAATVGISAAAEPGHTELYVDDVQLLMASSLGGGLVIDGNEIALPEEMLLPPASVEWDGDALDARSEAELDLEHPGWRDATGDPTHYALTDARRMVLDTSPGDGNEGKLVARGAAYLPEFSDDSQEDNPLDHVAVAYQLLPAYYILANLPVTAARPVALTPEAVREAMEETARRLATQREFAGKWDAGLADIGGAVAKAVKRQFVP